MRNKEGYPDPTAGRAIGEEVYEKYGVRFEVR